MDRSRMLERERGATSPSGRGRLRARIACLLLAALPLGACGCSPVLGAIVLMKGFKTIPPEFVGMKGDHVVIVCTAEFPVKLEFPKIDTDLARYMGERFRSEHIKAVRHGEIAEWLDTHPEQLDALTDYRTIEEIGKQFEADYVLVVNLKEMSLYEQGYQTLYQARALASLEVYDLEQGERVWSTEHQSTYPIGHPIPVNEVPESIFQVQFVKHLSQELGRYFYAHEPGDDILAF
jgi:hypothetical protein